MKASRAFDRYSCCWIWAWTRTRPCYVLRQATSHMIIRAKVGSRMVFKWSSVWVKGVWWHRVSIVISFDDFSIADNNGTEWCITVWREQFTPKVEPISRASGIRASLVENVSVHLVDIYFEVYGSYVTRNLIVFIDCSWIKRSLSLISLVLIVWHKEQSYLLKAFFTLRLEDVMKGPTTAFWMVCNRALFQTSIDISWSLRYSEGVKSSSRPSPFNSRDVTFLFTCLCCPWKYMVFQERIRTARVFRCANMNKPTMITRLASTFCPS